MDLKIRETTKRFDPTAIPSSSPTAEAGLTNRAPHPASGGPSWVIIKAEEAGVQLNLGDLWAYRELLYFLTLRDIKVRYKQTLMGVAWVVIQPLFLMLIVTLIFNRFARLDAAGMPYPLSAYTGLLLWAFFSNAVTNSTTSLINNTNLITKVYFPRMFIPAAAVGAGLVDLAIASFVLVGLAAYYGVTLSWSAVLLPLFIVLLALLALSIGLLISALTVKYRDLRHALPFLLQFWMFASPVIYPVSVIPERWRWILIINPLTGILEGFRAALAGHSLDWRAAGFSTALTAALLACAVYVFRRIEDTFADLI